MKTLRATESAKLIHLPQENSSGSLVAIPLCMSSSDEPFGVVDEGIPTCLNCIRVAVQMMDDELENVYLRQGHSAQSKHRIISLNSRFRDLDALYHAILSQKY